MWMHWGCCGRRTFFTKEWVVVTDLATLLAYWPNSVDFSRFVAGWISEDVLYGDHVLYCWCFHALWSHSGFRGVQFHASIVLIKPHRHILRFFHFAISCFPIKVSWIGFNVAIRSLSLLVDMDLWIVIVQNLWGIRVKTWLMIRYQCCAEMITSKRAGSYDAFWEVPTSMHWSRFRHSFTKMSCMHFALCLGKHCLPLFHTNRHIFFLHFEGLR